MNKLPRIPPEEYGRRLERLRSLMREKYLAALLLGTGRNLHYYSGYPSPPRIAARPFFLILPLEGDPIFICQTGRKEEGRRFSAWKDVRDYYELSKVPVKMIADALRERGACGKAVGMEFGIEHIFDVPHLEFLRLQEALGNTKLVNASDIIWKMRRVKSEAELACLRAAGRIAAEAYALAFSRAREGMTEKEIAAIILNFFDDQGAGDTFLVATSGSGNYELPSKPPEARRLQAGDMLWFDIGCTVDGYWSDFSRAGVVGEPSGEQIEAQEIVHRITWDAVQKVRPGVKASDIARFCNRQVKELKLPVTQDISWFAARCGHGVGLDLTEMPHISEQDDTPLEPGMAITIEPGFSTSYGTFHAEENLIVTRDGHEVISDAPRALARIGRR